MNSVIKAVQKAWRVGGWAPAVIFAAHEVLARFFDVYRVWPDVDIPFHFAGGLSIAFFVSGCFRTLPRGIARSSRTVLLELLLIGSLTATVAVFWEFAEFTRDRVFGTNVQVSLANTMQDLALGILGASSYIAFRAWKLRVRITDFWSVALDWINPPAAHPGPNSTPQRCGPGLASLENTET